ncbi:MAG: ATP12 family chaperone protein [Sphingomonadales bacterium]
MKRFYKRADYRAEDEGFAITLDDRRVRTPAKAFLDVPFEALARAIAGEWAAQGEEIAPDAMPLTRLANTAIDRVVGRKSEVVDEITRFAETDLLCCRADGPDSLVARQNESWQPLIEWANERHGARLAVTSGVLPVTQDDTAVAALRAAVDAFCPFAVTGLHGVITATGSVVVGLAVAEHRLSPDQAWSVSQIDEDFQAEKWGEDEEAMEAQARKRTEMMDAVRFLRLCLG